MPAEIVLKNGSEMEALRVPLRIHCLRAMSIGTNLPVASRARMAFISRCAPSRLSR